MAGAFWQLGGGAFRLPIIYFHDISKDQRGWFEDVIAEMTSTHRFIRLDELAGLPDDDEPRAMLVFDDALTSLLDNAIPTLERYNCPATVFVPTGWAGRKARWTAMTIRLGWTVMSWETIADLDSPMLRFESHTVTHPRLSKLASDRIMNELVVSKAMLEDRLDRPAEYLCYPFGQYDRRVVHAAKRAGYRGAFSSINSVWQPRSAPYEMRRLLCETGVEPEVVKMVLAGAGEWRGLYQLLRQKSKSVMGL